MKKRMTRFIAVFIALNVLYEVIFPTVAYALTGGPSQPEVQSFEPVGTTEMVDLFSGDFVYNIPLLDVEGYPINLSYHSGIGMDQEASWVGLGWNINPGVINRSMRGVPDDFDGDQISKEMYVKDNYTFGINLGMSMELFGIKPSYLGFLKKAGGKLSASIGVFYNNYKGLGYEKSLTPSISAGDKLKLKGALAISSNTQTGLTIAPSLTLSGSKEHDETTATLGVSVGSSYNSRSGIKTLTFSKDLSVSKTGTQTEKGKDKDGKTIGIAKIDKKTGEPLKFENTNTASNGGSSIGSSYQTYTPQITMPMTNTNISGRITVGGELLGINPDLFINGYYSNQSIAQTKIDKESYGYLYSHRSKGKANVLHDLNREKEGSYSKNSPVLPITNYSYDIYSVNGQGIGGMYRPHRSDLGFLHDDVMSSSGDGGSIGAEVGAGNIVKWGLDKTENSSGSQSDRWDLAEGNGLVNTFDWQKPEDVADPLYEPVYFKNAGEKNTVETSFLAYKQMNKAVRPSFESVDLGLIKFMIPQTRADQIIASGGDEREGTGIVPVTATDHLYKQKRDKRNQDIHYLTVAEKDFCLEKQIVSYKLNTKRYEWPGSTDPNIMPDYLPRNDANRKNSHITEITALNNEGVRYVYGIAAYNNKQEDVSFTLPDKSVYSNSTAEGNKRCDKGLATYEDANVSNTYNDGQGYGQPGYDAYFNKTIMPAYAHSYLLTAILSPDYVDTYGDGPDGDDMGNYTKINYTRVNASYKWRTPCGQNEAMYNEGLTSDKLDDKGSFVYGEKEIWYVHSIETKNYVAEFELEARQDGLGVNGPNGGIDPSAAQYRLNTITLYSLIDRLQNGADAVPIKTVHFVYEDYTSANALCKGIDNASGSNMGKLTLKEVYFTYGKSDKGKFSRYNFSYANNQPYNIKAYDRWGNFKEWGGCNNPTKIPNYEYPYVSQKKTGGVYDADNDADAWTLNKIELPSGGVIDVDYESDDYAYVQDKRAMQMCKVVGFGSDNDFGHIKANSLYEYKNWVTKDPYNYVFVEVTEPFTSNDPNEFAAKYLPDQVKPWDGTRYLFFNFLVNLGITDRDADRYDYVRGYAEIEDWGISNSTTAWIKVKDVGVDEDGGTASPFARAAWQFSRINTPFIVYPGSDAFRDKDGTSTAALKALTGFYSDILEAIEGINHKLLRLNYCQKVNVDRCWVRLNNGAKKKKGGGLRVKSIQLSDNWDNMGGIDGTTETATYGQAYDYTTTENGKEISSGVAAYEPMIGNDENQWRQPVLYQKENALVPDETFYAEEPFGETFFPTASVGYSKVTVRNLSRANVTKHATGETINEFYTARDFPTIVDRTEIQPIVEEPDWITSLFSFEVTSHTTALQGFQVELNDMHGKPKAKWIYAQDINADGKKKLISGEEYFYNTDPANMHHLNNNIRVIQPDGEMQENVMVGVDADMTLDSREQSGYTQQGGVQMNGDFMMIGPFPATTVIPLPSYSSDDSRFRTAVVTRIINRYGILDKTVVYNEDAVVSTQNYAFDAVTGEVLLSKTANEYNDNIYNLTYPAHWMYEGMGLAYENTGVTITATVSPYGYLLTPLNYKNYLSPGDEVSIEGDANKYWVLDENGSYVLKKGGGAFTAIIYPGDNTPKQIKVLRSGRRNMQSVPVQSWLTKKLPTTTQSGKQYVWGLTANSHDILNTGVALFSDQWRTYCRIDLLEDQIIYNTYDTTAFYHVFDLVNCMLTSGFDLYSSGDADNVNTSVPPVPLTNRSISSYWSSCYNSSFIYTYRQANGYPHTYQASMTKNAANNDYNSFSIIFNMPDCNGSSSSCELGSAFTNVFPYAVADIIFTRFEPISVSNSTPSPGAGAKWQLQGNMKVYYKLRSNPSGPEYFSILSFAMFLDPCISPEKYKKISGHNCVLRNPPNTIHPYQAGLKGIWRKKQDLLYLANRNYNNNIRVDGAYNVFDAYWTYYLPVGSTPGAWGPGPNASTWVWANEVTDYTPYIGQEIENRDPLNRYSTAIFNGLSLPIAIANNAQKQEIGFDGFENEGWSFQCFSDQWNFSTNNFSSTNSANLSIDNTYSHSGKSSVKLAGGTSISNTYPVEKCGPEVAPESFATLPCNDCIKPFVPYRSKDYVLSGWVRVDENRTNVNDRNVTVDVSFANSATVIHISPDGPIVDGWQRFEQKFTIPAAANAITVQLNRDASGKTTWYDDLRIHPANSNLKAFVYDPYTRRLSAQLDENNFASFYEYDEQGALKRVKKETERGIMTLKEVRSSIVKKP